MFGEKRWERIMRKYLLFPWKKETFHLLKTDAHKLNIIPLQFMTMSVSNITIIKVLIWLHRENTKMTFVGPQVLGYGRGLSKGHTIEFSQPHCGLRISVYR